MIEKPTTKTIYINTVNTEASPAANSTLLNNIVVAVKNTAIVEFSILTIQLIKAVSNELAMLKLSNKNNPFGYSLHIHIGFNANDTNPEIAVKNVE